MSVWVLFHVKQSYWIKKIIIVYIHPHFIKYKQGTLA